MLGLGDTALVLDALRPPPGMELDAAIGTTFTLDLAALLAVPVSAAFADSGDESAEAEPADLLETIRRYADRTVLFCQAGAISVPPAYRAALTFVEQTVVEVAKPDGGLFHPKSWLVRYVAPDGRNRHRILVMSRNLTFDRAWDVLVRLDEDPGAERRMSARPYLELLARIPEHARGLSASQAAAVQDLMASARRARFSVPDPFASGTLIAMWPGRRVWPFHEQCDHALAISPFLTARAVEDFLGSATTHSGVVSRAGSLDTVSTALGELEVEDVKRAKDVLLDAQRSLDDVEAEEPAMHGLHAKVFVQDVGEESTVWLGSANLTDAAFTRNWELMVRLTGPTRDVGYDALLSPRRRPDNLSWLVEDHVLPDGTDAAAEPESVLLAPAYALASGEVVLTLEADGERLAAQLTIAPYDVPEDLQVRAMLLSQKDLVPVTDGRARWEGLELFQVTPFIVLELASGDEKHRILVRAVLEGDDYEARRGTVLARAISSREDFMRYLAALLGLAPGGPPPEAGSDGDGWFGGMVMGDRVLEDLLATASRHPRRLASLDQTLTRLREDERFADIVPAEFHTLWDAVHAARGSAIR